MDTSIQAVMAECSKGSDENRMSFPEVVARLSAIGVERYHADLSRAEKTFYMPDGASFIAASKPVTGVAARDFSADGVSAAIQAIQQRQIDYMEFCRRIVAAGCVDYTVSLTGRRAIYSGRTGDFHVERFPASA
jgi:uncharacterized protein YbcV (DUF1398 family)